MWKGITLPGAFGEEHSYLKDLKESIFCKEIAACYYVVTLGYLAVLGIVILLNTYREVALFIVSLPLQLYNHEIYFNYNGIINPIIGTTLAYALVMSLITMLWITVILGIQQFWLIVYMFVFIRDVLIVKTINITLRVSSFLLNNLMNYFEKLITILSKAILFPFSIK